MKIECKVDFGGIDEKLRQLGPKLARKTLRRAVARVGDMWITEMKSRVPVGTGDLRNSIDKVIRTRRRGDVTSVSVSVGPTFNTKVERKDGDGSQQPGVYGMFVEFGTKRMNAEPWMRPTFDATAEKAVQLLAETLESDLEGVVKS